MLLLGSPIARDGKYRSLKAENKANFKLKNGLEGEKNSHFLIFFTFNFHLSFPALTFASRKFGRKIQNMANHSATKKDVRQAAKRRDSNRYYGKTTRNAIRELKANTEKKVYEESLPNVVSMIDKLAKRGIIHKNKAANLKSKLTKKANAIA